MHPFSKKPKFKIMKKLATAIVALLTTTLFFGQETTSFNKFSIEIQGGLHMPLQLVDNIETSDYTDFRSGQIGVRYMFDSCFGAKLSYGFNSFEDKENSWYERRGFTLKILWQRRYCYKS